MSILYPKNTQVAILSLVATFMPLAFTACSDDDSDSVAISAQQTNFTNQGGETTIAVSANATWVLTGAPSWVSLDQTFGDGDVSISALVLPNHTYSDRSVLLTVRCGCASDTLRISQEASIPQANTNANDAATFGSVAVRMEMPKLNPANTFVAHYAKLNNATDVNYSLEWNNELRHSAWVAYTLDKFSSQMNVTRASSDAFKPDPDLPAEMQVTNSFHTNDGFDRGHICASGDRLYSTEMNEQTFYFSNMSPMLNGFNAGIWRRMEDEEIGRAHV